MISRFRVDSDKRLPATSTTHPDKRRTTCPIKQIEQRPATDHETSEKGCGTASCAGCTWSTCTYATIRTAGSAAHVAGCPYSRLKRRVRVSLDGSAYESPWWAMHGGTLRPSRLCVNQSVPAAGGRQPCVPQPSVINDEAGRAPWRFPSASAPVRRHGPISSTVANQHRQPNLRPNLRGCENFLYWY